MFGFLFKLLALGLVVVAIGVLFDFRWVGNELRIRSRFAGEYREELPEPRRGAKPMDEHPAASRRQIQKLIQENSK